MTRPLRILLSLGLTLVYTAAAYAADADKCAILRIKAANSFSVCHFVAEKKAARNFEDPQTERCYTKLSRHFSRASGHCDGLDHGLLEQDLSSGISRIASGIGLAARTGVPLDLGALCGSGSAWDVATRSCAESSRAADAEGSSLRARPSDCPAYKIKGARVFGTCGFAAEKKVVRTVAAPDTSHCPAKLEKYLQRAEAICVGNPLSEGDIGHAVSRLTGAIGRAARGGSVLDLGAFCGAGTSWNASTQECVVGGGSLLELPAGLSEFQIQQEVDGVLEDRRYWVAAPESFENGKTYPVVFALHGNGGSGAPFISKLADRVAAGDFVGVYPDGIANSWNLGREESTADDVAFVEAIVADLAEYEQVDTEEMFVLGFSNGAGMAHLLAIETDLFRGIGAVVTSLLENNQPVPGTKSVSVIQVLGTEDNLIPYDGGVGVLGYEFMAAEASAAAWAAANSCATPGFETATSQGNIRIEFTGCSGGGTVLHYGIVGAGHGFPSSTEGGVEDLVIDFFLDQLD